MTTQTTLKELAMQEKPKIYKRIEDFDSINVNQKITTRTYVTKEGKESLIKEIFLYNEVTAQKERVRVPPSVIWGLQALLKINPHLGYFRVVKTGEGIDPRYTVLSVDENGP